MNIIKKAKANGAGRIQIESKGFFKKNIEINAKIDAKTGEVRFFIDEKDLNILNKD